MTSSQHAGSTLFSPRGILELRKRRGAGILLGVLLGFLVGLVTGAVAAGIALGFLVGIIFDSSTTSPESARSGQK